MTVGAGLMTTFKSILAKPCGSDVKSFSASALGWVNNKLGSPLRQCFLLSMYPSVSPLKFFGQSLGGAIFVSVGQNVLSTKLVSGLSGLPNLDSKVIVSLGATELRDYVGPEHLGEVLRVYNHVLDDVFMAAAILAAISVVGAVLTEWKSVKGKNVKGA